MHTNFTIFSCKETSKADNQRLRRRSCNLILFLSSQNSPLLSLSPSNLHSLPLSLSIHLIFFHNIFKKNQGNQQAFIDFFRENSLLSFQDSSPTLKAKTREKGIKLETLCPLYARVYTKKNCEKRTRNQAANLLAPGAPWSSAGTIRRERCLRCRSRPSSQTYSSTHRNEAACACFCGRPRQW